MLLVVFERITKTWDGAVGSYGGPTTAYVDPQTLKAYHFIPISK
jgi:hypothetical protein